MAFIGVDVAKESLEVADATGSRGRSSPNTTAGIDTMLGWLSGGYPHGDLQLIVEPTSTYHHPLVQALGSPVVGLHFDQSGASFSRRTAFPRVQGKRAKTVRVDARLLASLGESQQPEPSPPPEEDQEGLKALRRHLEWLEKGLRAARNRLDTASFSPWTPRSALDSLERTIQPLDEERRLVREAMASQQEQNQEWTRQIALFTTIPGVGE